MEREERRLHQGRRKGNDRRDFNDPNYNGLERRSGKNRRTGEDRRDLE